MAPAPPDLADAPGRVLSDGLAPLIECLRARGHRVIAPVARDGAIGLDEIASADDIATGWVDVQQPGRYRAYRAGAALFGHAVPAMAWKRWLHPERRLVVRARRDGATSTVERPTAAADPLAFVGIQPCDLAALARLDTVFARDDDYRARRDRLVVVAIACTAATDDCFCVSAATGPWPGPGADIVLREPGDGTVLATAASDVGAELLAELGPSSGASWEQWESAERLVADCAARQTRRLDQAAIDAAAASLDDPGWDAVAERCLSCGNCTLACPTCFCTSITDSSSLGGTEFERWERWDSCFTLGFAHVHGGSVRASAGSRYRQWYLHKLVTWHDQFGESGCVGCGRCITWCPTGIDLTEEIVHDRQR